MTVQHLTLENRSKYLGIQQIRCGDGESVFEAANRTFGQGQAYVETGVNASHFNPPPEHIAKRGEPIGEVTVRIKESFYVYRS